MRPDLLSGRPNFGRPTFGGRRVVFSRIYFRGNLLSGRSTSGTCLQYVLVDLLPGQSTLEDLLCFWTTTGKSICRSTFVFGPFAGYCYVGAILVVV